MDIRRLLIFTVVSLGILVGWNLFVMPRLIPPKPKAVPNQAEKKPAGEDREPPVADNGLAIGPGKADDEGEPGENPAAKPDGEKLAAAEKRDADKNPGAEQPNDKQAPDKPAAPELPKFPEKTIKLGSDEFLTGYRQLVTLTSKGAAVKQIELNDPRYRALKKDAAKRHPPQLLVGEDENEPYTLEMVVPQVGADVHLNKLNWELLEPLPAAAEPHSVAVFRLKVEDLEIVKRYELPMVDKDAPQPEAPAYAMKVDLTFRNLGRQPRTVNYVLQGPTGLPLENIENTQKFRDIVVGFETGPGSVTNELMTAKTIAAGKGEEWKQPVKYIGTDVQFFAALICPVPDQLHAPYTRSINQQLIGRDKQEKSDVSVQLTSVDLQLQKAGAAEGKDEVKHEYRLFAGPKRDDVLIPIGAQKVIDFGMFHWISRPMLSLLKAFYSLFHNWGLAIICLTIVVRSALFPLSIRQARGAAKMQALQPEIAALKEKYGNDKEKLARAQMELFRKHNYNPAAGCLPVFLQLPIFMGLYQALNHAVDLRLAGFLWIDNLAAPDALFRMPFAIPYLGQEFNLLPLITIVLFYVQQKMFMPPPANDEQAMQQKMMNFMMIFMGFMFYKVPSGLCVYFIASSLWGLGERKLLPKLKGGATTTPPADPSQGRRKDPGSDDKDGNGGGGGLWAMLLKAAEKETSARRSGDRRR
jgi:YidC/Oxa1 family membrane protein insertase